MKGEGFKLDSDKIYHPLTTQIAHEFQYCYHVTELKLLIDIIEGGLRPGGETGGRTHVFFNPFAPWDARYKNILGGELTHLGTIRVALVFSVNNLIGFNGMVTASGQIVVGGNVPFSEVFSVNNLIGFNGMVTASGQIVVGGNVPFSEVEGAWYQNNRQDGDTWFQQRAEEQIGTANATWVFLGTVIVPTGALFWETCQIRAVAWQHYWMYGPKHWHCALRRKRRLQLIQNTAKVGNHCTDAKS
eukprot:s3480_g2.t1